MKIKRLDEITDDNPYKKALKNLNEFHSDQKSDIDSLLGPNKEDMGEMANARALDLFVDGQVFPKALANKITFEEFTELIAAFAATWIEGVLVGQQIQAEVVFDMLGER